MITSRFRRASQRPAAGAAARRLARETSRRLSLAAIPVASLPDALHDAPVPGAAIAQPCGNRGLAVAIGLGTVASTLVLIVAEYLALGRLLHFLRGAVAWGAPAIASGLAARVLYALFASGGSS